jgi:hypothetical protein
LKKKSERATPGAGDTTVDERFEYLENPARRSKDKLLLVLLRARRDELSAGVLDGITEEER